MGPDVTRVLVAGGSGQLAVALDETAPAYSLKIARVGRPLLDFAQPASIEQVFSDASPALVVNAAAYTAVDAAEDDADAALRANCDGPRILAQLCDSAGIPLIHVSTDYVFDGHKGAPYAETDVTAPQGVYGKTKLAGEAAVLSECERTIILRTSWIYSAVGKNFVRTMLNAGQRLDRLRVVADQTGCPTSSVDLARAIWAIVARLTKSGWQADYRGIYHAAGIGWTTWHGLAVATFEEAARYGMRKPVIDAITTVEWPTKAMRPADSRLDCTKLQMVFGLSLPPWRNSLAQVIDTIFQPAKMPALQAG